MKNVMVFSCGAVPAMDINYALRGSQEYTVYGASSYDDHGKYVYKNYIGDVPYLYEPDFIDRFNDILRKYHIDFIIPLHEDMILFFQQHIEEIHATVVSSCLETALICRYKSRQYEKLSDFDFVPKTFSDVDEVVDFPVFIKKDTDQGARNAFRVDNKEQLICYANMPGMIICEYLPGEEVTVDCFTDRHGKLLLVNPRVADRMLAGIDVHARRLLNDSEIIDIAEKINSRIAFRGPWFFQVRKDRFGKYKLLEISTRFAGAFGLTRCMDINTPLMALRDFDNKDVAFDYNDSSIEADKMFIGRYSLPLVYDAVYIDGEDCLIDNGVINTLFVMFLYQCVNENKKIFILCNDERSTRRNLNDMKINNELFEYVNLTKNLNSHSIFISKNEYRRSTVRKEKHVFCFEPTIIEVLLNWRG